MKSKIKIKITPNHLKMSTNLRISQEIYFSMLIGSISRNIFLHVNMIFCIFPYILYVSRSLSCVVYICTL
ncbi:hypothetical protein ACS0TY_010277 [Phlomoides rotata]